ncbi:MAG: hypothetical protein H8E34_07905 [Bacteroidetes bacterium]|nr:hypothetical protein [Bacteroidota bacterium]MBL6943633.1 hypothetical protein [Bacteroidales bacterium]
MKAYSKYLKILILLVGVITSTVSNGQLMNHYWALNFNSQSSLLSGAVVAGDGGNTSIYFNPSTISEIKNGSNLSFAASLFTWGVYYFKNALGAGINISNVSFNVQPQFLSYSYRPKDSKFAFAFSAITRMKDRFDINYYDSRNIDVLSSSPGPENYNVAFTYFLEYSDNWFGLAGSYDVSERFKIGSSIFLSTTHIAYKTSTSAIAFSPTDTLWVDGIPNPAPVTEGSYIESFKFVDYRLIAKLGFSYVVEKWRFGLNFTSQSLSLFSVGKEAYREQRLTNVTNPNNNEFMPGYVIVNGQTQGEITTRVKFPFSVSFGFIYEVNKAENRLYFTMEYFSGISPYKLIDAPINDNITSNIIYNSLQNKDWLSIADVAKPVLNVAVGYRWQLNKNLMFLTGFRTDFNNINNADYKEYSKYNKVNTADINIYHYNGGVQFYFLHKYLLVAGGELSFGFDKNQKQIANFSNPVEYSSADRRVLQGPLENKMDVYYFGLNIYLSATFNFGGNK